jgi:hypothetical protein
MQIRAADIVELGNWLGENEFKVSPQQLVVAAKLAASPRAPRKAEALQAWLAPVFCTGPAQQQAFAVLYGKWLEARGVTVQIDTSLAGGSDRVEHVRLVRLPWWRLAAGVMLFAMVVGLWALLAMHHRPRELEVLVQGGAGPVVGAQVDGDHSPVAGISTDEQGRARLRYTRADLPLTITARHPTTRTASNESVVVVRLIESPPNSTVQLTFEEAAPSAVVPSVPPRAGVAWLRTLPPPPPVQGADSKVFVQHPDRVRLGLLALLASLPVLWWLVEHWRRRAFLQRLPADDDATTQLLRAEGGRPMRALQAELRHLARELRRRIVIPSRQLDLPATLRTTLRRGGDVQLMFGARAEPEHLVLVDRASYKDHQARLADEVVAALHGHGVIVERYVFDGSLAHCHHAPLDGAVMYGGAQSLERLAGRHPDARLLVFSDGRGLIDPMTGLPGAAMDTLRTWAQPVLVTTQSRSRWGAREWLLARGGVALVAMDGTGLRDLGDLYACGREPAAVHSDARDRVRAPHLRAADRLLDRRPLDADALDDLLRGLKAELEVGTYAWLCACAVYPEIHWGITMAVGDALAGTHLAAERNSTRELAELSRLPWMRRGHMPDWLRAVLVGQLDRKSGKAVRDALAGYLDRLAHDGRARSDADALAVGLSARDAEPWHDALMRLRRWWSRRVGGGPQSGARTSRDIVFLRFMSGQQWLAVPAVVRLLRLLYREGVPLLGPRALVPLAAVLLAGAVALWGTPPIETAITVLGPAIQPSLSAMVLNSDGSLLALADDEKRISTVRVQDGLVTAAVSLPGGAEVLQQVPGLAWEGAALRYASVQRDLASAAPVGGPITMAPVRAAVGYGSQVTSAAAPPLADRQRSPLTLQTGSSAVAERSTLCVAYDAARRQFIAFDERGPFFALLKGRRVVTCAVSAGSRMLAVLDDRGGVALLPLQRYEAAVERDGLLPVATVQDAGANLAVSDDGRTIALRRSDGQVVVLRGTDHRQEVVPANGNGPLALSGDGRVLAQAQADGQVLLYRLEPGRGRDMLLTMSTSTSGKQALRGLADVLGRRYGFETVAMNVSSSFREQWVNLLDTMAPEDRLLLVEMDNGDMSEPPPAALLEQLAKLRAREVLAVVETSYVDASKDAPSKTTSSRGGRARLLLSRPGPGLVPRLTALLAAATGPVTASSLPDLLDRHLPLPAIRSVARDARNSITVNFVNADIAATTRTLENLLDLHIDVDPAVNGKVTIRTTHPISRTQVWQAYQDALGEGGYAVEVSGSRLRVMRRAATVLQRWAAAGHESGEVILVPIGGPIDVDLRWDRAPLRDRADEPMPPLLEAPPSKASVPLYTSVVLAKERNDIEHVTCSADGRIAVASSMSEGFSIWDPTSRRLLRKQGGDEGDGLWQAAVSRDGQRIYAAPDRRLLAYDARSGEVVGEGPDSGLQVNRTVVLSPDEKWVAATWRHSTAPMLLDTRTLRADRALALPNEGSFESKQRALVFSPDGARLYAGGTDGVYVWDVRSGEFLAFWTHLGRRSVIEQIAVSPSGGEIAVAIRGAADLQLRDAATGRVLRQLDAKMPDDWVTSVAWSLDGTLLSGYTNGQIVQWDPATGSQILPSLTGHGDDVNAISFCGSGRLFVTASNDDTIRVWRRTPAPDQPGAVGLPR